MRSAPGQHCAVVAILAALAVAQCGCATKFVAKRINPLRPAKTAGWDPGEFSASTAAKLVALHSKLSWKNGDPRKSIRALEPAAATDLSARRAVIEIALAAGIRAHAEFLTDRGAAGYYLCAAEHAYDARSQGDREFREFALKASRYAVARLAGLREVAMEEGVQLGTNIQGPMRAYRIILRNDLPGAVGLNRFQRVVPTDEFRIANVEQTAFVDGVGTPLIGKVHGVSNARASREFSMADDQWVPLTATVQFGPPAPVRNATFAIYDRKNVEAVEIGGRSEPLAGDFSTAFAVRTYELGKENLLTLGILGFLRGDRFFDRTGLYPVEFPRTDRIPVVFVHGLISDPGDWRFLHNALLADQELRQRYQFWAFYYPTSMAVPWSSTLFRRELARVHREMNPGGRNPKLNQMILVGHSMGGLLSRMQISESGEPIYRQYFTKPVDQLRLSVSDRSMIKDMFYFSPNPDISEVIFICVPHKGSELATNWIGRIGRTLARLPLTVLHTTAHILTLNRDAIAADVSVRPGTSIDSLSPNGKFARTLQEMPMSPRVTKYSIIGNRGKKGPLEKSSDGVVPYWSSHIDGVPETIIPSTHSGPEYSACAVKVRELLLNKPAVTKAVQPARKSVSKSRMKLSQREEPVRAVGMR
jgi:hypothetical protein